MINIILSGGSGTRLWPLSRTKLPKQFVRLIDKQSLFQKTLERNATLCQTVFVVTNTEQYFLALDQLHENPEISNQHSMFLLEPIGRNTAPAIALACLCLDEDDIVLITPSDHLIKDQTAYETAVHQAKYLAEQGYLVTFGIRPTYPETGFGYIESQGDDVISFKEKPNTETAQKYLDSNATLPHNASLIKSQPSSFLWNSGMFCFKAGVFLDELKQHCPEIHKSCSDALEGLDTPYSSYSPIHSALNTQPLTLSIEHSKMLHIPADSIDYAVMEKSNKVKVVSCDIGWSDLGSFDALYDEAKSEQTENALILRGDNAIVPISIDAKNNLVVARDRQIALIDVEDLMVVDTRDALLISKKGSSQKVKAVVELLKTNNSALTTEHLKVHRPWGTYEVLIDSQQYKVKRIVVKPDHKLSLQKHYHRNEHWVVVSGTATVTVEGESYLIRPNESTYIKMGHAHRLENHGKIDLVMVEVQVGEYTGEDDIERLDDHYGRGPLLP